MIHTYTHAYIHIILNCNVKRPQQIDKLIVTIDVKYIKMYGSTKLKKEFDFAAIPTPRTVYYLSLQAAAC